VMSEHATSGCYALSLHDALPIFLLRLIKIVELVNGLQRLAGELRTIHIVITGGELPQVGLQIGCPIIVKCLCVAENGCQKNDGKKCDKLLHNGPLRFSNPKVSPSASYFRCNVGISLPAVIATHFYGHTPAAHWLCVPPGCSQGPRNDP